MRVSLESIRRPVKVRLATAIVVLSLLIIGAILAAPAPPVAAAKATTQQSLTAMPPCTRRVTVNSNPCGAMIYIDGIQVGRTPMSFPMPTGRYTLVLLAPGHQQYTQRILVPDAPLQIDAKLVPEK
jgi:hypothetical protein